METPADGERESAEATAPWRAEAAPLIAEVTADGDAAEEGISRQIIRPRLLMFLFCQVFFGKISRITKG